MEGAIPPFNPSPFQLFREVHMGTDQNISVPSPTDLQSLSERFELLKPRQGEESRLSEEEFDPSVAQLACPNVCWFVGRCARLPLTCQSYSWMWAVMLDVLQDVIFDLHSSSFQCFLVVFCPPLLVH